MNKATRSRTRCVSFAAGIIGALLPFSGHAADEANGKKLALQWCSSCHVVADNQATASGASIPSFFDVAKGGMWTETKLKTFLADPHPQMPDMNLTTYEIQDISRYITSLK